MIPYIFGIIAFTFWMVVNVYHLIKFGFFDFTGKITLLIFSSLAIIVIGFSILFLWNTPWTNTFNLWDIPSALIPLPQKYDPTLIQ